VRETRRRSALAFQEWSCKLEMPEEWGNPANAGPSKASCASVRCEVREEGMPSPFSSFTDPSRGLSESVLRKPPVGGRLYTTLANNKYG
jgi:hypothetical protein